MPGFQDRVALVTGAAQGIGEGIARRLAAGGARVGVLDLDEDSAAKTASAIRADGGQAIGLAADVSKREDVQAAIDALVEEFGGLHILVNNAGIIRDNAIRKLTDDDWSLVMDVHLRGAFHCTQIAQKHMVEARFGRIICLSSTSALGNRGQLNYSTAKMGLQGFVRTAAIELGPFGITANAIAPGFIVTAMTKGTAERTGASIEDWISFAESTFPVRRAGDPADVANAVAFFAGEEAGYVTGQTIYVDGGSILV
jgi:3-oxoacyl-[acyl-carrier protein] reductase